MSAPGLFLLSTFAAGLLAGSAECGAQRVTTQAAPTAAQASAGASSSTTVKQDDLKWLVGRWRCVSREYFGKEQLMAGFNDSMLDYLNVYFPYADEHLTLNLTDNPDERPIAAEFLVTHVYEIGEFEERRVPMFEGGPVRIGKDRIWYGAPLSQDFNFKYSTEARNGRLWLTLESRAMRFELVKLVAGVGDVRQSSVSAAIRSYSPERIEELRLQYDRLTASHRAEH